MSCWVLSKEAGSLEDFLRIFVAVRNLDFPIRLPHLSTLCLGAGGGPEAWQLLLLFAIYGGLFALMLPHDGVEAGAGSLS